MVEIYCEWCGTKLGEFDYDYHKPSPIYIEPCQKCIEDAMAERVVEETDD